MGRSFCLAGLLLAACAALAQGGERTLNLAPSKPVAGEARHALVIGNNAYTNSPLRNPVNDARAMAKSLGEAGFNVMLVENGTQLGMQRAIRNFGNHIAKGGVGLFYYAGHGLQVKGRNYLVPVNAEIGVEDEIEFTTVDVNLVLAKLDSAKNSLNIVILDACRNNPFARGWRSAQSGLAQMDAPTGTFIAFATAPGSVAADGAGENGVYTKYLLAEMAQPGVPIELMFKQVRNGVMAETKGRQIPWESSSLRGEFAFHGTPGAAINRAEVDKLIQAALERQRQELAALGLRPSEPPKPALDLAAKPPAPVLTASVAPTPAAAADRGLPRIGDTWTYRLIKPNTATGPRERQYAVTVAAVTSAGILDRHRLEGAAEAEWVHDPRAYLVSLGASVFSPYLQVLGNLPPSGRLERIQIRDSGCTQDYVCDADGVVAGRERVNTAAGTFDAIKVVVEHTWRPSQPHPYVGANSNGARRLTIWYAPSVKRAVKFSSRLDFGAYPPIEPNFDLELVSYRVQ